MSKEKLRATYPDLAKFKDDIEKEFGKLAGILIQDKGKTVVKWGEDWGDTVSFHAEGSKC